MAARSKTPQARKAPESAAESLLIQSAESLGRMIGALQRQLDDATRRLSQFKDGEPSMDGSAATVPLSAKPKRKSMTGSNAGNNRSSAARRPRKAPAKKTRTR
jgi:hypothetical protein